MKCLLTRFVVVTFVSAITLIAYSAVAQTTATYDLNKVVDSWTAITGIVVTESAKKQVAEGLARQFSDNGEAAGFTKTEVEVLSKKITSHEPLMVIGSLMRDNIKTTEFGKILGDFDAKSGTIDFRSPRQETLVWQTFDARRILEVLNKLPTLNIIVKPVPPRDYKISINDQEVQVTEKSEYGVPSGKIKVSVSRAGKAPCNWAGTLHGTQTQTITCSF